MYGRALLGYLSEGFYDFARGARAFFRGVPGTHDDGGDDPRDGDGHDRDASQVPPCPPFKPLEPRQVVVLGLFLQAKTKAKGNKRKNKTKRKHDDHDNPGELNANTNPANSDNNRYESLADLPTKETNNVNHYEDHQQIPKDTENNNADSTNNPSKVIIAGDSMTKHLNGFKMSTAKTKVQVSTFAGCTTLDMKDHINPILRKEPDKLIVHVGTNNLRGHETPTKCAEEIISLAKAIKSNLPTTTATDLV